MTYHDIDLGLHQSAVCEIADSDLTETELTDLGCLADDLEEALPIMERMRIVGLKIRGWTVKILRKPRTATQEAPGPATPSPPASRDSLDSGGGSNEVGGSVQAKGDRNARQADTIPRLSPLPLSPSGGLNGHEHGKGSSCQPSGLPLATAGTELAPPRDLHDQDHGHRVADRR